MSTNFRVYWGRQKGRTRFSFSSDAITPFSIVLVSASEGIEADNTNPNFRFVGDANIRVENIAPSEGIVWFIVSIDWFEPLPMYTDIVIVEREFLGFIRANGV